MKKNACFILLLIISISSMAQAPVHRATVTDTMFELPPAFTPVVYDSAKLSGYYFLSALTQGISNLMILDKYGDVVYYKPLPPGTIGFNFGLQPNNMMIYSNLHKYFMMDSEFRVIDSVSCKNLYQTDPRSMQILPNGHFLILGADTVTMDLSRYHFKNGAYGSAQAKVRWTAIEEQDAERNVVFDWHAKDHFTFDDLDTFFLAQTPIIEVMHSNAVMMDNDGNLLLSSRNFNEIIKIDRANGSVVWRFGGKRNQFSFINCTIPFWGQHDIKRIGNGDVTLFDNGDNTVPHCARAMEFKLDEKNKIAILKWQYVFDSTMYSLGQGNVQRLDNSKTLISFGKAVNNTICFIIVDSNNSKIFQLNGIKSFYVSSCPDLPWQPHRPQVILKDSAGIIYLEAEAGFSSYCWNTGSSERIIQADHKDEYCVYVPYGDGAYISSKKIVVKN